jgi:SAM-dependent methyltransferase
VCGQDETNRLFEKQGCTFVQCVNDGLVYINPQPEADELHDIYDTLGREVRITPESIAASEDHPDYRRRFIQYRQNNHLLEIGCATGAFLIRCRNDGWTVHGVEFSQPSSAFARDKQGLDVTTGTIHDARYPDGFFDVVCLWATLEHVPDPRDVLTEIYRILRPGGFLALSVPSWRGISIRLIGSKHRWVGRNHLFYYSRLNMKKTLLDIGFSKAEMHTRGFNVKAFIQDAWGSQPKTRESQDAVMKSRMKKGKRRLPVVSPLKSLLSRGLGLFNLGDSLLVDAVK